MLEHIFCYISEPVKLVSLLMHAIKLTNTNLKKIPFCSHKTLVLCYTFFSVLWALCSQIEVSKSLAKANSSFEN